MRDVPSFLARKFRGRERDARKYISCLVRQLSVAFASSNQSIGAFSYPSVSIAPLLWQAAWS